MLVQELHERGNRTVVMGRSRTKLDDLEKCFDTVTTYPCDLSRRGQVEEAMDQITARHPDISLLINNAAVQFTPTFIADDFEYSGIDVEITTNLTAPLSITSLFLSSVLPRQSQARIVNISSGLAFYPKTGSAVYCATKAAIHSVSQSLRYQLEKTPVAVTEVILPLVDTPMTHGRGSGKLSAKDAATAIIEGIEAGRDEIYVGKARFLLPLMRVAPGIVKRMMKRY